jgi:dienelactone hydrolase
MSTFRMRKTFVSFVIGFFMTSCAAPPAVPTATATALPKPTPTKTVAVMEIDENMTYEQAVHLFDYPSDIPFEMKERSALIEEDGVTVYDILYTAHKPEYGAGRGWTVAYLIRPDGEGPFAGILFMHWLGGGITRREFLDEAKLLANQGVVSLLIDGTFPWTTIPKDGESDRLQVIDQVIELRRAIDFLLTQPGVDPQRIAYVGHDYGGIYGGVLSGVETRIKAYVLMAAPGNFSNWSIDYFLPSSIEETEYRKQMAVVEPMLYIPHADPAALLFQFSNNDGFVPKDEAMKFFDAASDPKEIKWYDTGHRLDAAAQADRLQWLTDQLDLPNAP